VSGIVVRRRFRLVVLIIISVLLGLACFVYAWFVYPSDWWAVGFLVALLVAVPLFLLGLRDALKRPLERWFSPKQLLLHIFAIFAALVGVLVLLSQGGAIDRSPLKAILLVLILPCVVYLVPILAVLRRKASFEEVLSFYIRRKQGGG